QEITETPDGLYGHASAFKPPTQPVDVDLHGTFTEVGVPSRQGIDYLPLGHYFADPRHQHLEYGEFTHRATESVPIDPHFTPGRIELQRARLYDGAGQARPTAAKCTHTSSQFCQLKRLGDVIIGAGVQASHPIIDTITRGQDQYRKCLPALA